MARAGGGRAVEGALQHLRTELRDYFGFTNQIREGLNVKLPERPEALVLLEQCRALNLPLEAGGVMDQPHIWLLEVAVVIEEERMNNVISAAALGASNAK